MEKDPAKPESDIAKEAYKGPSAIAAAAGEGYLAHFIYMFGGLVTGITGGLLIGDPMVKIVNKVRETASGWIEAGGVPRFFGGIVTFLFGHGDHAKLEGEALREVEQERRLGFGFKITNHIPGARGWLNNMNPATRERLFAALPLGSIFAAFGFFVMPVLLAGKGAHKGNEGKRQFERAKDEIWDLRAENDQLRQKNTELQNQVGDSTRPADPAPADTKPEDAAKPAPETPADPKKEAKDDDSKDTSGKDDKTPDSEAKREEPKDDTKKDAKDESAETKPDAATRTDAPTAPGERTAPAKSNGSWGEGIRDQQTARAEQPPIVA